MVRVYVDAIGLNTTMQNHSYVAAQLDGRRAWEWGEAKHELRSLEMFDVVKETEATDETGDDLFTNLGTSQSSHMVMDDPISEWVAQCGRRYE